MRRADGYEATLVNAAVLLAHVMDARLIGGSRESQFEYAEMTAPRGVKRYVSKLADKMGYRY